jgi:hypothetical protein
MMIDVTSVQKFTPQNMVDLFTNGLAQLSISQAIEINGRTYTRADIPGLEQQLLFWERRAQIAAGGSMVSVARLSDPDIGVDQRNPGNA